MLNINIIKHQDKLFGNNKNSSFGRSRFLTDTKTKVFIQNFICRRLHPHTLLTVLYEIFNDSTIYNIHK